LPLNYTILTAPTWLGRKLCPLFEISATLGQDIERTKLDFIVVPAGTGHRSPRRRRFQDHGLSVDDDLLLAQPARRLDNPEYRLLQS